MIRFTRSAAAALLVSGLASAAWAGVTDPVPLINGTVKAKHVFTVVGILVYPGSGVVVMCTSLEKSKDVDIAIEVFDQAGDVVNDITMGDGVVRTVDPGRTGTFNVSYDATGVHYTVASELVVSAGSILQGSLRVVSSSTKIACTAANLDAENTLPKFIWPLNMIAKSKQKGD